LKIILLHSVSVITNFVIPKRKKKKKTRNQYASPPKGNALPAGPLSEFFTKLGTGRVSEVCNSRQTSRLWLLKCGPTGDEIAKIGIFWYKFAPKGVYPKRFLQNLASGSDSQDRTLLPNLSIVTFKMWAYSPQDRRN